MPPRILLAVLLALSGLSGHASPQAPATPVFTPEEAEQRRLKQHMALADDWANLKRYREENAALGRPAAGERRVVFFGDSITEGWVKSTPEFFAGRGWVGRGISGQTTPQMLVRFRQDVVALEPAVVVILAGTNDISGKTGPATPGMIQDNLKSMADLARANGIRAVLASVLPARHYYWAPAVEPAPQIVALNAWMRDYAASAGLGFVDLHTPLADASGGMKAEFSADGVHPTRAGYEVMAPLAARAVAEALARDR